MSPQFYGELTAAAPDFDLKPPDSLIQEADPLHLDIDDEELVRTINRRIDQSETFYNDTKKIKERRERNKGYLFGKQLKEGELKYYNARYIDNIPYEAEGIIKPIALSKLPDLLVKPASPERKELAENITKLMNNDIRKRENRNVLGLAFRHHPVYFTGVIKAIWDPEKGDKGDYRFRVVHPDNIVMDHASPTNDEKDMEYVAEKREMTVKEMVMTFPKKESKILRICGIQNDSSEKEKRMASKHTVWEVWFRWPKAQVDEETGEKKWETINGVMWKYKTLLLGKMKNPNWDWQGKKRLYIKEMDEKRELTDEEATQAIFGGMEGVTSERFYYNHLEDPAFPYFFMGYDQWGEMPLDETSRIEQILPLQDNVNKRGRQISEMNDRAKGKHVFSTEGGIEKKTIEEMDMSNPDEDILVEGDVSKVHSFIPGQPAPAQLYKEQEQERQKAFAKMRTHSTTRGEKTSDVATTNQILREADFGGIDDLVNETINPAAEWMANWAMQFIKLRYTTYHTRKILGKAGDTTLMMVSQDSIDDGMEVVVTASGVDKVQRKKEAYERARMKLTDPISFFEDTEASDPIGRAEKVILFMLSPELYYQKYVKTRDTQGMADALKKEPVPAGNGQASPDQAAATAAPPQGGGTPADSWLMAYGGGGHGLSERRNQAG